MNVPKEYLVAAVAAAFVTGSLVGSFLKLDAVAKSTSTTIGTTVPGILQSAVESVQNGMMDLRGNGQAAADWAAANINAFFDNTSNHVQYGFALAALGTEVVFDYATTGALAACILIIRAMDLSLGGFPRQIYQSIGGRLKKLLQDGLAVLPEDNTYIQVIAGYAVGLGVAILLYVSTTWAITELGKQEVKRKRWRVFS